MRLIHLLSVACCLAAAVALVLPAGAQAGFCGGQTGYNATYCPRLVRACDLLMRIVWPRCDPLCSRDRAIWSLRWRLLYLRSRGCGT